MLYCSLTITGSIPITQWSKSQYGTLSRELFAVAGLDGSRVFPKSQTTLLGGFEFLHSFDSSKRHCSLLQRKLLVGTFRVVLEAELSGDLATVFRYFFWQSRCRTEPVAGGYSING